MLIRRCTCCPHSSTFISLLTHQYTLLSSFISIRCSPHSSVYVVLLIHCAKLISPAGTHSSVYMLSSLIDCSTHSSIHVVLSLSILVDIRCSPRSSDYIDLTSSQSFVGVHAVLVVIFTLFEFVIVGVAAHEIRLRSDATALHIHERCEQWKNARKMLYLIYNRDFMVVVKIEGTCGILWLQCNSRAYGATVTLHTAQTYKYNENRVVTRMKFPSERI